MRLQSVLTDAGEVGSVGLVAGLANAAGTLADPFSIAQARHSRILKKLLVAFEKEKVVRIHVGTRWRS